MFDKFIKMCYDTFPPIHIVTLLREKLTCIIIQLQFTSIEKKRPIIRAYNLQEIIFTTAYFGRIKKMTAIVGGIL